RSQRAHRVRLRHALLLRASACAPRTESDVRATARALARHGARRAVGVATPSPRQLHHRTRSHACDIHANAETDRLTLQLATSTRKSGERSSRCVAAFPFGNVRCANPSHGANTWISPLTCAAWNLHSYQFSARCMPTAIVCSPGASARTRQSEAPLCSAPS